MPTCHSGERCFPAPPVILRSEGDEESLGHALGREGRFFAALRMTMGECAQNDSGGVRAERQGRVCHSGERRFPTPLPFWGAALSRPPCHSEERRFAALSFWEPALSHPPAILRSGAFPLPPCHSEERRRRRIFGACFGTGGKILRCAQNDNGGAQNNRAAVAPAVRPASR